MTFPRSAKVGLFLVGGLALFCVGLFLIGNHNQLFSHHYGIYTEFANIGSIQSGAKVRVSGMDAGQVSAVAIPDHASGKFRLKLDVDKKFRNLIREDSVASIQTEGMVGNQFVNVKKGTDNSPVCKPGCTVGSEEPVNMGDLIRQSGGILKSVEGTITDLHKRADLAMDNVTSATGNANAMIVSVRGNVQKIAANGAQVTAGVERLVSGVQAGKGTVGKLLVDDQLADNVDTTVANARKASSNVEDASANVKKASKNVEQASEDANQMVAEVKTSVHDFLNSPDNQKTADNLRDTISQADRATRNLASDTEAIKHNFFLRGFFHRRGFYSLTTFNRTKYARSKFVKDPGKRVWLRADDLFTTAANGGQQLSPEGEEVLDRAVSKIADDVTNNPIMVEGYSQTGPPAQRLIVSSERAGDVKKYLETKFHLNPRLIGTIPLENKPPERTGVPSWDGICLAVVVSH